MKNSSKKIRNSRSTLMSSKCVLRKSEQFKGSLRNNNERRKYYSLKRKMKK